MTDRRQFIAAGSAFSLALAAGTVPAAAQGKYPSKAIRWVVPRPAGAPQDSIARKLAETVSRLLGVPVIIDNKPGASGTIGAAEVARRTLAAMIAKEQSPALSTA